MSETSGQRLSRMLALVPWLLTHQGSTIAQTAEHFGISPEQLVKDLNLLIVSGRPGYLHGDLLDIQFWDEGGHITVLDPQTLDRPVALSTEEAAALLVSLQVLAQIPGAHDREAIISTAEKLQIAAGSVPPIAVQVSAGSEEIIATAVKNHRVLRIEYQSDLEAPTVRDIEPHKILIVNGKAYVDAWCRKAESHRTFRMDRIVSTSDTGESFTPRSAVANTRFLESTRDVELVVRPTATWILDLLNAREMARSEDGIHVAVAVADDEWLVRLLLMLGPDLVQGPRDFVRAAQSLAGQLLVRMGQKQ